MTHPAKGPSLRITLAAAIEAALRSGTPGYPRATRIHVDLVIATGWPSLPRTSRSMRARHATALAWAFGRDGQARQALTLAGRHAMPLLAAAAAEADLLVQSECYAALAETYLLHGYLSDAAACAQFATQYADSGSSAPHQFRAAALLAAAEALNGEYTAAGATLGSAGDLDRGRGWLSASWPIAIATTQIGFRSGKLDQARLAMESLSAAAADPLERTVARLGQAWIESADGQHQSVLTTVDTLTRRVDAYHVPPFLLDLAVSAKSMSLAHLGQPGAVLSLVDHRASPPGHPICFEMQAAGAHLQLGDPRKALAVTEPCVTKCPDHSLRTFPSVLLRRAVANEILERHDLADTDFSRATHLAVELAGIRPAIGLPIEILERLYHRLLANEPNLRPAVSDRLPSSAEYTTPEPLAFDLSTLTRREQVLGAWLATDLTIAGIAAELNVSANTVKTQAKSVYRKLGVSSRQEAVDQLERAGLHLGNYRPTSTNTQR